MQGFAFGPGTAPRLFGGMLLGVGVIVTALGFLTVGPPLERYSFRGIFFVAASILVFAYGIRPLGLFLASFLTFMVSALASKGDALGRDDDLGGSPDRLLRRALRLSAQSSISTLA